MTTENTEQNRTTPHLVFIHGWLANKTLWQTWIETYFSSFRVTLLELPGHGNRPSLVADTTQETLLTAWQNDLIAQLPEKSTLIGWSLGGLLAQNIAITHPERVEKLILLASSPCFVQQDNWQTALSLNEFSRYLTDIHTDPDNLFKSFILLESLGSPKPKRTFVQVTQSLFPITANHQALTQGLQLLNQVDLRAQLVQITTPTLWLLAEADAIVPIELANQLVQLNPQAQIHRLPHCGHLPFLTEAEQTAEAMKHWLVTHQ